MFHLRIKVENTICCLKRQKSLADWAERDAKTIDPGKGSQ